MVETLQIGLTIIGSVVASSGFWVYLQNKMESKSVKTTLLIGLAHDRIMTLSLKYIDRGWISKDEYEDLQNYLYSPYKTMGGNGSANRIMAEVDSLPIKNIRPGSKKKEEVL